MAVTVILPSPLRPYAGHQASVEYEAHTVGDALDRLTAAYGDLKKHLYTPDGRIRSFVNVYLNDEDIRFLKQEQTPTKAGDTITIVPSIAGGAIDASAGAGF
jgi:adenylyltransferase/sulfurtransferase